MRYGSIDGEDAFISLFLTVSDVGDTTAIYDWNDPGHIRLYSETGKFIRFVGGRGSGPGEFQHPAHIFHRADGTWAVFDRRTPRLTVLSRDFASVVATYALPPFPAVYDVQQLPDERLVVSGVLYTEESAGLPLHLLSRNGELVRSFGADPAIIGNWDTDAFYRTVAVSGSGAIWAAHRNEYRVELWDTAGSLVQAIYRTVDWFPDFSKRVFFNAVRGNPPTPFVAGIREDAEGLWVYLSTPRADWDEELVPAPASQPTSRGVVFRSTPHAMFTTRIEVLDPATGNVRATGTIPYGISTVSLSGRAFAPVVELDAFRIQAWRTTLHSQGGTQ